VSDESDESDETHEPRRAVVGAVGGGVLASIGAWWLSQGGNEASEPQSAATTPTPAETRSPTDTRTQVSTNTQTAPSTNTRTPRETPTATPTDRPTPTSTQTQTATQTESPTATPTESNRVVVTHRGERTQIELTNVWTDAKVVDIGGEVIPSDSDDPTLLRVRVIVRNTSGQTYRRLGALARVPNPPTNAAGIDLIDDTARSVDLDVSAGGRAQLYPQLEWHPDLDRVEVSVDSGATFQQTRTKTPTPTPTENGFL